MTFFRRSLHSFDKSFLFLFSFLLKSSLTSHISSIEAEVFSVQNNYHKLSGQRFQLAAVYPAGRGPVRQSADISPAGCWESCVWIRSTWRTSCNTPVSKTHYCSCTQYQWLHIFLCLNINMFASRSKARRFKFGWGWCIFQDVKILSTRTLSWGSRVWDFRLIKEYF